MCPQFPVGCPKTQTEPSLVTFKKKKSEQTIYGQMPFTISLRHLYYREPFSNRSQQLIICERDALKRLTFILREAQVICDRFGRLY